MDRREYYTLLRARRICPKELIPWCDSGGDGFPSPFTSVDIGTVYERSNCASKGRRHG
jgi:hypothetical protein